MTEGGILFSGLDASAPAVLDAEPGWFSLPDVVDVAPNRWGRFDELEERGYDHARAQLAETDLGPLPGR